MNRHALATATQLPFDEGALVRAAQRGDLDAFNELVLAYQSQIYNIALRILGDEASADDTTQQTIIAAHQHLNTFRGGSFRHWLLRTVTNACYDLLRYQRRRPAVSLNAVVHSTNPGDDDDASFDEVLAADIESPLDVTERHELRSALTQAIKALPASQRVVFVLSDVHGLSHHELEQITGWPAGTVKSRLFRARARLRELLLASGDLLPGKYQRTHPSRTSIALPASRSQPCARQPEPCIV